MGRSDQSETMLVLLAQQCDVAAFEELLRRLHGPLRQYVTRMVGGSVADDVLQDVARRILWQHPPTRRYLREGHEPAEVGYLSRSPQNFNYLLCLTTTLPLSFIKT